MVYKLATTADLKHLPTMGKCLRDTITRHVNTLVKEYGADRNVEEDDGGFVLYASPGTSQEEIKQVFDFSNSIAEYIDFVDAPEESFCVALFLLNNEYSVTIITALADTPQAIIKEM